MKLFGNSSHSDRGPAQHAQTHGEKKTEGGEILPKIRSSAETPEIKDLPERRKASPAGDAAPAPKVRTSGEPKNKSAQPKKKRIARKVLLGIGIVVLAFLVFLTILALTGNWSALADIFLFWGKPPEMTTPAPETTLPVAATTVPPTAKPTEMPEESVTPEETEPPEDGDDTGEAPAVPMSSDRKEGVYTILLVGVDKESSSTDTIMVVSFDTKNHKLTGTSIPRDTLINIGWFTTPKKINAVYPGYKNNNQDPVEGLKLHIKSVLGFDVDSYVVVYLQAVEDAVDAIGGVEFDVPEGMYYNDPYQGLYINIAPGLQTLDGENALKVCRFRSTYAQGDLKRIEVQHDFLKAMASQLIKKGIPNLPKLVEIIYNDVDTDLTTENIAWFANQFLKCKDSDVVFQTAPNNPSGINNISFVGLDVTPWLEMINSSINPYKADVTTGNVNILTFGGSAGIYSTTGSIAGGWNSFACWSCTASYHGPGEHVYATQETASPAPAAGTDTAEQPNPGTTEPETPGAEDGPTVMPADPEDPFPIESGGDEAFPEDGITE